MIEKLLRNILDVPGADGVCVFDLQGNLLCNRFPSLFIEEIFPKERFAITVLPLVRWAIAELQVDLFRFTAGHDHDGISQVLS